MSENDAPKIFVMTSNPFVLDGVRYLFGKSEICITHVRPCTREILSISTCPQQSLFIADLSSEIEAFELSSALPAAARNLRFVLFGSFKIITSMPREVVSLAPAVLDRASGRDCLPEICRLVSVGVRVHSPEMLQWLTEQPKPNSRPRALAVKDGRPGGRAFEIYDTEGRLPVALSQSELKVLRCLADGSSNKIIARHFSLSECTVKIHVGNILRKIQSKNRTQAAIWARQQGICNEQISG